MILLNFAHPLDNGQIEKIEALTGQKVATLKNIKIHLEHDRSYPEQVKDLIDTIDLASNDWQRQPIVINPPAYNFAAVTVLAELHGRMGYFPPCLCLRPIDDSTPPRFEIGEIVNLNQVREQARRRR